MFKILTLILLIYSCEMVNAAECKISNTAELIQSVVEFQKCEQQAPAVFSTFKISDFPVALTGVNDNFNLVTVVQKGQIVSTFNVETPIDFQGKTFDFHGPDFSFGNANPQLTSPLLKIGIRNALVYNIGYQFDQNQTGIQFWGLNVHFFLMLHEGFHFFVQSTKDILAKWPEGYEGMSFEARDQMQGKCFLGSSKIIDLVKAERLAIINAFLFIKAGDQISAKLSSKEFIRLRRLRYQALSDVQILDEKNVLRSCEYFENLASVVEGIPDFIAMASLLNLKLLTPTNVVNYFSEDNQAFYYYFPLLQGLVMTQDAPELMLKVLDAPEKGVEKVFEDWVN